MSSSQSVSHCFIHVHIRLGDKVGCAWFAFDEQDGSWVDTCVLNAQAVKYDDCIREAHALHKKFPLIVGMVFVPCTNDVLTPEQKRLIHVE